MDYINEEMREQAAGYMAEIGMSEYFLNSIKKGNHDLFVSCYKTEEMQKTIKDWAKEPGFGDIDKDITFFVFIDC